MKVKSDRGQSQDQNEELAALEARRPEAFARLEEKEARAQRLRFQTPAAFAAGQAARLKLEGNATRLRGEMLTALDWTDFDTALARWCELYVETIATEAAILHVQSIIDRAKERHSETEV